MSTFSLYVNFGGTTEEAFRFYQSVFGGELERLQRFQGAPGTEQLPAALQQKIMHVQLRVGPNLVLHGTDAMEEMGHPLTVGNNFSLMLEPDSKEEATQKFQALADGGKITMPLQDVFWGAYYGQLTDRFGVQWMVNYE